ncbi:MAG: CofH family radical SAM protein, partial [Planctomycetaceae bacterium]|nr:CofH family radical SAM protein [Planctomycetaceae bacterium]
FVGILPAQGGDSIPQPSRRLEACVPRDFAILLTPPTANKNSLKSLDRKPRNHYNGLGSVVRSNRSEDQSSREMPTSENPLRPDEAHALFSPEVDLHELGILANAQKQKISGQNVYYSVNVHLNPTNVCRFRCPLCAFSCDAKDAKAYRLINSEIFALVENAVHSGCSELHWVGGIPDNVPYSWYAATLKEIHRRFPELSIKAWTAVEILHFAQTTCRTVADILSELKSFGLAALPGGGAEIFAPEIRKRIAPDKPNAEAWLDVHRTAHELGIPTNATMLFGHLELVRHRIDHLLRLRELQEESIRENRPARFETFVPLVFHPQGTAFSDRKMIPAHEILRTIAIGRLFLHNFSHIKAYWVTLGVELAQIALGYGADDFDGTIQRERIHHDAGSQVPFGLSEQRIRELIEETGAIAVRR